LIERLNTGVVNIIYIINMKLIIFAINHFFAI